MKTVFCRNVEEMQLLANSFLNAVQKEVFTDNPEVATTIGLSGDLGAGKTAFVKCVARSLGIQEEVTSPTFVIEKIYPLENNKFDHLIHIDAYRLAGGSELTVLGWDEIYTNTKNLILIEWPGQLGELLAGIPVLTFEFVDTTTRSVTIPDLYANFFQA